MVSSPVPRARPWILVADDDPNIRRLFVTLLRESGYRPIEATTGREALELMRLVAPELVVLDLRMPELTGQEVLTYIRTTYVIRQTPVLVVSGHLDDVEGVDLGLNVVGRLAKPVDAVTILQAVQRALAAASPARPGVPPPPPAR
jgi:CheY-like chemotaxis protein